MNIGATVPQKGTDRMDIRFSQFDYHGGLNCGETLDVKISGKWIPTRIDVDDIVGLIVRIKI